MQVHFIDDYEYVSSSEEYMCQIWGSYSSVAEDSVLLGCDTLALHVPGILKNHIAFKTLEVTCPLIQCHVLEGLNPQECIRNSEISLRLVFI